MPTCSARPERPTRRPRSAALAVAAVLVLAAAPVARADDAPDPDLAAAARSASQCSPGAFCLWSGPGYTGTFWSVSSGGTFNPPLTQAKSLWNRSAFDVRTYNAPSGGGSSVCWNTGAQTSNTSVATVSVRTMAATTC